MVNPDGELDQPRNKILDQLREIQTKASTVVQQLKNLPHEEEQRVTLYAQERIAKLHTLSSLDEPTRVRIEPTVSAAAREAHISEGRMTAIREFRAEHPWIRRFSNILIVITVGWLLLVWAVSAPLVSLTPDDQADAVFLAGAVFCAIILPFRRIIERPKGRYTSAKAALVSFFLAFTIAFTHGWWSAQILDITSNPVVQNWEPYQGRTVSTMHGAEMLVAMTKILFRVTFLMVIFESGKALLLNAGSAEPNASASAVLLDSILGLAWLLEEVTKEDSRDTAERDGEIKSQGYLSSPERKEFIERQESTAQFVESTWYKTARLKDHAANIEIRRISDGIATSIRRWKPVAAIGGRDEMNRMKDAFAIAVVNSADGDWSLLASDVSARELFSRRLARSLRRTLALLVLAGAVVLIFVRPFTWTEGLGQATVATPLMLVAVFLAGFIDPAIYDRMTPVTRLGAELLPKR
ncbi:hypothetical protein [Streptomyces sp. NPDC005760]|uniref:hypothetical protein n=1 Tax=Streptomyces sp. NPDC005760 TaxID=3156718 RepID=UPI003404A6C8